MNAPVVRRHHIVWTRRRILRNGVAAAGLGVLAACGVPSVRPAPKIPTVAFVSPNPPDLEDFLKPFRALGYVEGGTATIASRISVRTETEDALRPVVEEVVRLPADIIVAVGSTAAKLAKDATRTIPVVFFGVADAVRLELVMNVERPEGNVTGVTNYSAKAIGKGLEYLLQIVPGAARVAFVGNLPGNPGAKLQLAAAQKTALATGVEIVEFSLRDADDIDRVFGSLFNSGVKAVMVGSDAITLRNKPQLVAAAARFGLPTVYSRREFADLGGLIAFGPSYPALFERLAVFVDKIVRGKAPGDLPVEEPSKFDLVINSTTAQALGITVPQALLVRAEVIR